MRKVVSLFWTRARRYSTLEKKTRKPPPLIEIRKATFYREHPLLTTNNDASRTNSQRPLFPRLSFKLPSNPQNPPCWAIIGPSSSGKTTLLQILQGQHLCEPPLARSYPLLSSDDYIHSRAERHGRSIGYIGFDGEKGQSSGGSTRGAYLSARYESRTEATDFSLEAYLKGQTELNSSEEETAIEESKKERLSKAVRDLKLEYLLKMPMRNLSNGQTRRARIAKALLENPELLLIDEPYMGLDPPTQISLSLLLHRLASQSAPRIILALRMQDPVPNWITHIIRLDGLNVQVADMGKRDDVLGRIQGQETVISSESPFKIRSPSNRWQRTQRALLETKKIMKYQRKSTKQSFIEMNGVEVKYGGKTVLGGGKIPGLRFGYQRGLWWRVNPMDRWGIFGPNGSGKTTLLSLLCSDHPQSYSLPIKIFGRSRLPETGQPGISIFDIQSQIGHSSPEVHAFFPRHFTVRQAIESAWADTFLSKPKLTSLVDMRVESGLRFFQDELNPVPHHHPEIKRSGWRAPFETDAIEWADHIKFGELPFGSQRVALFLRAVIKRPKIVVLDEAFSGMDEAVRDKCMELLQEGGKGWMSGDPFIEPIQKNQALICVSHVREELPSCIRQWMFLPKPGTKDPAYMGEVGTRGECCTALRDDPKKWEDIWSLG